MPHGSTISKPLDASGGMRPRGWRKPVPKLIPDPPKSLSRSSSFRHLTLLPGNEPQPPMPDNWRENIDKALGKDRHTRRPKSPTPPYASSPDVTSLDCGLHRLDIKTSARTGTEDKALPPPPVMRVARRHSAGGSSIAESTSTSSTRVETPTRDIGLPIGSLSSRRATQRSRPLVEAEHDQRGTGGDDRQFYGPSDAQYRIVYPQGLNSSNLGITRRHVAVVPIFPRPKADTCSTDHTAFETLEDARSVRHPYASSVMLDKIAQEAGPNCEPETGLGCMDCGHIFRRLLSRRPRPEMRY